MFDSPPSILSQKCDLNNNPQQQSAQTILSSNSSSSLSSSSNSSSSSLSFSSLKNHHNLTTKTAMSIVDLNNNESLLLLMMQQQKQKQKQQQQFHLKNSINMNLTSNSQIFPMSPCSPLPCSPTTSAPMSPIHTSSSSTSTTTTTTSPFQPATSTSTSHNSRNAIFRIVTLDNEPVMSQENLSQQQQQQQLVTKQQVNNEDSNESLTSSPITISSQLQPDQLIKLQNQAAAQSLTNNNQLINNNNNNNNVNLHNSIASTASSTTTTNPTTATTTTNTTTTTTNPTTTTTNPTTNTTTTTTTTTSTTSNNMSGEETEEENEILEESPDNRWIKRNEPVSQRDVPGIDQAFLAMDTEYGIEVVWNEIILSGSKKLKNKQEENQIDLVFENLINLNHPNIVKFHKYWRDTNTDKKNNKQPRIIFITEYMSCGSLKQFLRKAKRTNQPIKKQTWKRWCIQLLTALHYLHNCDPPIIHGDLSCDTIFIQHNGLIKIGSIAPDIVNQHVKTCIDKVWWSKNAHFLAPELNDIYTANTTNELTTNNQNLTSHLLQPPPQQQQQSLSNNINNNSTTAVDIYAFGMVALEMFHFELGGNGEHQVMPEVIKQSIECLPDENQKHFINWCLETDPKKRPTAKQLLFHKLLFEVPSLRLLTAHQIIKHQNESRETCDADFRRPLNFVIASLNRNFKETESNSADQSLSSSSSSSTSNSSNSLSGVVVGGGGGNISPTTNLTSNPLINSNKKQFDFKYSLLAHFEANKYLEDVKNGIYPLTAYGLNQYNINNNNTTSNTNTTLDNNNKQQQQQKQLFDNNNDQLDSRTLLNVNSEINSLSLNPSAISPSNTSVSGASTSVANISSANLSSNSSSSSTSPSQSLTSQVNINQQQQQQQQNELINITNSNPNNNSTYSTTNMNNLIEQDDKKDIEPELILNQQKFTNNNIDSIIYSSPSVSPPPPQPLSINLKQQTDQIVHNNTNGLPSRTQSPLTMQTNGAFINSNINTNMQQTSPTPLQQQQQQNQSNENNNKLGENNETNLNVEKRHAKKMDWYIVCIEKFTNYKLSLNITFDDKTSRFLESQINNNDSANKLTEELIYYGLVSEKDKESLFNTIQEALNKRDQSDTNQEYLSK